MPTLPMFPLGSVLLPSVFLPLHVFEPRYRALTEDCLAGDGEFGVVLIERGSEVGGGDVRSGVGTVARILEAVPFEDGRWALGVVGTRRVRITAWLDDDPYPRAEVEDWDDTTTDASGDLADSAHHAARAAAVVATLRRVLAARAELGDAVAPATQELSDDPVLASFQAVALSPFGPADQQRLLATPGADERWMRLGELLAEEEVFVAQRQQLDAAAGPTDEDFPFD